MKKRYLVVIFLVMVVSLCACGHNHTWKDATCTEPKTCTECGEKQGVAAGHTWKDATCTESKTCTVCGEKQGEATGHTWKDATCTEPKTCTVCGEKQGEATGHKWKDATCTEPKTCTVCGEKDGEPSGHKWNEATCTEPKTCSVCGEKDGKPSEHTWEDASCTKPKTCSICGETEGKALGHTWKKPTCTVPKTCSVCGVTEGKALGHSCADWTIIKESTCIDFGVESGVCTVCGEEITRAVALAEHKPGNWEIDKKATISEKGTKVRKCTDCGKVLESEVYEFETFDISKIKNRSNFKYDDFNKSWKYYASYDKEYADATESIAIIIFSEDNGTNLEEIDIIAALYWKDAARTPRIVKSLEFLIDETIYHIDMDKSDSRDESCSILYTDTSYKLIKDLAKTSKLKIKINYDYSSTEFDLSSNPFKTLCKDIVDNNMWEYYIPNLILELFDTTTIR